MFSIFSRKRKSLKAKVAFITNGPGEYAVETVGESYYDEALELICGGRTEDGHDFQTKALLMPVDDNPYDANAVKVMIEGRHVGHLSREAAPAFRRLLSDAAPSAIAAQCDAWITGGWDRGDGDTGHFGVKLDLPIENGGKLICEIKEVEFRKL